MKMRSVDNEKRNKEISLLLTFSIGSIVFILFYFLMALSWLSLSAMKEELSTLTSSQKKFLTREVQFAEKYLKFLESLPQKDRIDKYTLKIVNSTLKNIKSLLNSNISYAELVKAENALLKDFEIMVGVERKFILNNCLQENAKKSKSQN